MESKDRNVDTGSPGYAEVNLFQNKAKITMVKSVDGD
jgi:hypothetical protein